MISCDYLNLSLADEHVTYYTLKRNICFVYVVHSTPVSSINKTDRHDVAEMLLNVALSTTNPIHVLTLKRCNPNTLIFCSNRYIKVPDLRYYVYNSLNTNVPGITILM
jgi:hypothetical protein